MAIAKYAKTCSKNTPGNPFLAYTEVANVTSVTIAAGEITAITAGAAAFKEFDADIDFTKMTLEGTGGSSFFQNNKIEAKFSKLSIALVTAKESLVDAVNCGALAIITDGNGQSWLVGWNANELGTRPLNKITANYDTGAKPSDEDTAAYLITLEGETGYDPVPFDSTLNATIVGGTAVFIDFN